MKNQKLLSALLAAGICGSLCAAEKAAEQAPAKADAPKLAEAAPSADIWAKVPDVVAEINGTPVKKSEIIAVLMEQLPDGKLPPFFNEDLVMQIVPGLVKQHVAAKLIDQDMEKNKVAVTKEQAKSFLESQLKQMSEVRLNEFKQRLAIMQKTIDQYIDEVSANEEARKSIGMQIFAEKTFLKDVKTSDEEAKKFYDENPRYFTALNTSHILIQVPEKASEAEQKQAFDKAKELIAQLKKNPADFASLAAKESACQSKAKGGSLGTTPLGQLVPEYEKAAMALKPGEITSEPVKTAFGYHIIRNDAKEASTMIPFDQVKDRIIASLNDQKAMAAQEKYLQGLEKAANVKYFVEMPKAPQLPADK